MIFLFYILNDDCYLFLVINTQSQRLFLFLNQWHLETLITKNSNFFCTNINEGTLKSSQPDQENYLESSNVHAIPYTHSMLQH